MVSKAHSEISNRILRDYNQATLLNAEEINELIDRFIFLMKGKPTLKRIKDGSVLVVGDIHGDFTILKSIIAGFRKNDHINHLIFLGDIVDRGSQSISCLNLLYALKITYPERVHIVRGNHEAISVNSHYGFLADITQFSDSSETNQKTINNSLPELFVNFNRSFGAMPLALVHEEFRYFFVHGGIPIEPISLKEINDLPKADLLLSNPIIKQMLWNDPREGVEKYTYSMRGDGIYIYGQEVLDNFLKQNNLKMIIRAHEVFPDGHVYMFNNKLLSLFTSEDFYQGVNAKIAKITDKGKIDIFHPSSNSY
ncbi:MAG: metallophosphoesterase [Candidatus Heimdallarchaeota archaeon]|nr:metallophosphoesterase [Candidatus Heimdallarchaeota archaeon]MBY8994780.1 metallophosphoesterase [Candidatus Heimdallarchaeota archaeon]